MFVSEKCVLFFEKSEVIFTKWCFIFVLFFDKSDYDHWLKEVLLALLVIEAYRLLLYLLQVVFVPGLFTADTIHLTVAPSGGDDLSVSSLSSVL